MITVRAAKPGDGQLLMRTTRLLAEQHGMGHRFVATAERFEQALFCNHPIVGALIAEADCEFAGSIFWHRSFSTNAAREIIYLEVLVVLPEHRRKGVARALVQQLAKVAKAREAFAVYWLMAGWNSDAEAFYKSLGATIDTDFAVCTIRDEALEALAA